MGFEPANACLGIGRLSVHPNTLLFLILCDAARADSTNKATLLARDFYCAVGGAPLERRRCLLVRLSPFGSLALAATKITVKVAAGRTCPCYPIAWLMRRGYGSFDSRRNPSSRSRAEQGRASRRHGSGSRVHKTNLEDRISEGWT